MTLLALPTSRRTRRPSLTPMIDVVFLLLVFFMLASRFGSEGALTVTGGNDGQSDYTGPPRLVEVLTDGVLLNGSDIREETLAAQLETLMSAPSDTIVLRPGEGVAVQRLVDVMQALSAHGFPGLVILE